jgi:hypothetical protein
MAVQKTKNLLRVRRRDVMATVARVANMNWLELESFLRKLAVGRVA